MKLEQQIQVTFRYAICFTRNVFAPDNDVLLSQIQGSRPKVAFFLDSGLERAQPQLPSQIEQWLHKHQDNIRPCPSLTVHGGEACKNDSEYCLRIAGILRDRHLDRHSYVVIVGGGAVLDAVGFAASITHRGIRHIRVPTTVLSQCDAGVGVKNGMDEHGVKNYVGTFAPPFAVLNDYSFLPTLEDREWLGGVAEAFKVAIIRDAAFFDELCENAARLRRRDLPAMERVVRRAAVLHLDHTRTSGDPFEFGAARPLDFGHWSAHKLEAMSEYAIGHGQAVKVSENFGLRITQVGSLRDRITALGRR